MSETRMSTWWMCFGTRAVYPARMPVKRAGYHVRGGSRLVRSGRVEFEPVVETEHREQRVDDGRGEVGAGASTRLGRGLSRRAGRRVGPVVRHRRVGIRGGDDAGLDGYGLPGETVGLALAVVALVMVTHG